MNSSIYLFLFAGLVVVVLTVFIILKPGVELKNYDSFAQCLTESGAKMYGAYWCSHCENQKKMFGASFEYIDYTECADPNVEGMLPVCAEAGIEGYPTWILGDGEVIPGEVPLEYLAEKINCELPE